MTRKRILASVVLVVPVLLLAALDLHSPASGASNEVRSQTDLERGLEGARPFEGRWTGLGYSPFKEGSTTELGRSAGFKNKIAKTIRRLEATPESIRDRALIAAISGDIEDAARALEAGIEAHPRDASLYNDLAMTRLVKARIERDPYQLILAFSAIREAVVLDGTLTAAAFNHALILERLHLRKQSCQAWRRYLSLDSDSGWAEEARDHLATLESSEREPVPAVYEAIHAGHLREAEALVEASAQPIRFHVEREVLADWARAMEQGDTRSAEELGRMAETLSSLLLKASEDRLLADAVETVRKSRRSALRDLSIAHQLYGEGSRLYEQGHYREAEELFVTAKLSFDRAGSPFRLWATFNADLCEYKQGNVDWAVDSVLKMRNIAATSGYHNLVGRIDWLVGLVRLEKADPTAALVSFRNALNVFEQTREKSYQGAMASMIAIAFTYLGDPDEAWKYHFLAVSTMVRAGDDATLSAAYGSLARSLLTKGQARAALAFQTEAILLEDIWSNPTRISEAFWWRSMILRDLGKPSLALRDIAQARELCSTIPEASTRERNMAGLLVTEGTILGSIDPRSAVNVLTKALDLYKNSSYYYLLVDIYLERARALRRLSIVRAAEEDLLAAIEEYERQRTWVRSSRQRISYFSRAEDAFDEMVDFQAEDRVDAQKAFEFSERSRARETLDSVKCSGISMCAERPLGLGDILARIPARTTLIQYHVLRDRLLIWSLREGKILLHQVKLDRRDLEALTSNFLSAVQDSKDDQRYVDLSKKLYQVLLQPVERDIVASDRLVIVPDGTLAGLPFSGLLNPQNNQFLVEALPVATEPSSTLYISAVQVVEKRRRGGFSSLAVGNPAFDHLLHPDLVNLPAAEREARALAEQDPQSTLLTGREATIARFVQEIGRHDLIHFGGHALIDESAPGGSRLLFAASQDKSGDLFGAEIERLHLTRPRLVVLSACNTGRGSYRSLEGLSDLAKPFLVAGVPTVLISLWRVEDRKSEAFWGIFYSELLSKSDAGAALREAQLSMIRNVDPSYHAPRAWAGYRLVGVF